jgi:hypothetical protein
MQTELDAYLVAYNTKRPHQGRGMNGQDAGQSVRTATTPGGTDARYFGNTVAAAASQMRVTRILIDRHFRSG